MSTDNKGEVVFTPELQLTINLSARQSSSKISIRDISDSITILEGIRGLLKDHLVLIYLDDDNVVCGVDAFLHHLEELNQERPNRALARTMVNYASVKAVRKVIIAHTAMDIDRPDIDTVAANEILDLMLKMELMEIETYDFIVMGAQGYFSYRANTEAWEMLQGKLQPRRVFWGIGKP